MNVALERMLQTFETPTMEIEGFECDKRKRLHWMDRENLLKIGYEDSLLSF